MLARIINTEVPTDRDSNGNIFIDRSPKIFEVILEFLRTEHLGMENATFSLKQLEIEADYYGLDRLLRVIRPDNDGSREPPLQKVSFTPEELITAITACQNES